MNYDLLFCNANRLPRFLLLPAFCCLCLIFTSCGTNKTDGDIIESNVSLRDTNIVSNDGETIACRIGGQGKFTILFVHGWCIDKSYWEAQMLHFGKEARTIAIDLPGFGESGKDRMEYSIAGYARDLQTVITDLNLRNVILVGHSMAGDIILETALAMPEITALVGVDCFKDIDVQLDSTMEAEVDRFMNMLKDKYTEIAPAYAEKSLFSSSTPPEIKSKVLEAIQTADPVIATQCLQAVFDYAEIEKKRLEKLHQKLYLINTDNPSTNKKALKKLGIDFQIYPISNSGHYPMIEQPVEFDKALDAILEDVRGVLAQRCSKLESRS